MRATLLLCLLFVTSPMSLTVYAQEAAPTLAIARAGSDVRLTWSNGVLQAGGGPERVYRDVLPQPQSPLSFKPTNRAQFFRVRTGPITNAPTTLQGLSYELPGAQNSYVSFSSSGNVYSISRPGGPAETGAYTAARSNESWIATLTNAETGAVSTLLLNFSAFGAGTFLFRRRWEPPAVVSALSRSTCPTPLCTTFTPFQFTQMPAAYPE